MDPVHAALVKGLGDNDDNDDDDEDYVDKDYDDGNDNDDDYHKDHDDNDEDNDEAVGSAKTSDTKSIFDNPRTDGLDSRINLEIK